MLSSWQVFVLILVGAETLSLLGLLWICSIHFCWETKHFVGNVVCGIDRCKLPCLKQSIWWDIKCCPICFQKVFLFLIFFFSGVMVYWLWMLSKTCLNKSCEPKSVCPIRSWRSVFAVLNGIFYCPNLTGMESKIKFAHWNCMLKWRWEGNGRKGEPTPFPAIRLAMETCL